jgi:hypothetical protein
MKGKGTAWPFTCVCPPSHECTYKIHPEEVGMAEDQTRYLPNKYSNTEVRFHAFLTSEQARSERYASHADLPPGKKTLVPTR